jgi:hypothetical protein
MAKCPETLKKKKNIALRFFLALVGLLRYIMPMFKALLVAAVVLGLFYKYDSTRELSSCIARCIETCR